MENEFPLENEFPISERKKMQTSIDIITDIISLAK